MIFRRDRNPVESYRSKLPDNPVLWWLGQAGFLLGMGGKRILIDPYLSDFLAQKYSGTVYPHKRMMPPPLKISDVEKIDYCLCSHSHSDHMDPGLLPLLSVQNPSCIFIVPYAVKEVAIERGVPSARLICIDAGDEYPLGGEMMLSAVPSAHEELKQDSEGRYFFLGYIIKWNDYTVYHSGDCIPYPGLDSWIMKFNIDLALLPVNGRSPELSRSGILGNFNINEVCQIVRKHGIKYIIPHHFGMFDFNTVSRQSIDSAVRQNSLEERVFPAETGIMYSLSR